MAARVLIDWDPATGADLRRRLEAAFAALLIDHVDAAAIDPDPDAPTPLRLAVATPSGRIVRRDAGLVIVAINPNGDAPTLQLPPNALALSPADFDPPHRRWIALVERLGQKLARPGLADFVQANADPAQLAAWSLDHPNDPLAKDVPISHSPAVLHERLAAATLRAETAERALETSGLNESDAVRALRRAEVETAAARARIAELEAERERLTLLADSTAFAVTPLPADIRAHVLTARDHSWRARLAAARASEAAAQYPDALAWPGLANGGARYSGETMNRLPHGFGVMTFSNGASYAGRFDNGRRAGHGVGHQQGFTWTGEWSGEAHGFGLLESEGGARYEGEVAPDETGAPRRVPNCGHLWPAPDTRRVAPPPRNTTVHQPLARQLAPPND